MKDYKLIAEKLNEIIEHIGGIDRENCEDCKRFSKELSQLESEPDIDIAEKDKILSDFANKMEFKSIYDDPDLANASNEAVNVMFNEMKTEQEICPICKTTYLSNQVCTTCTRELCSPFNGEKQSEPTERKTAEEIAYKYIIKDENEEDTDCVFIDDVIKAILEFNNISYLRNESQRKSIEEIIKETHLEWDGVNPKLNDWAKSIAVNFASQSLPEITDEEIEKQALEQAKYESYPIDGDYDMQSYSDFIEAIKWYRNELKKRL